MDAFVHIFIFVYFGWFGNYSARVSKVAYRQGVLWPVTYF